MDNISEDLLHRLMARDAGRPRCPRHGTNCGVVRDPVEIKGKEYFCVYHSALGCWHVQRTLEPSLREARDTSWCTQKSVSEALGALIFLPPPCQPDTPEDDSETLMLPSFCYRDLEFAWMKFPGQDWEIAHV